MVEIAIPNGRIREMEEPDIPALVAMCKEEEIQRFYFMGQRLNLEQYWRQCTNPSQNQNSDPRLDYYLPIETEGTVKGLLAFFLKSRLSAKSCTIEHIFELSYFIGKEHRRKGIAESAIKRAVPFAYDVLNASSVHAICLAENKASRNLLKKLNFREKTPGCSENNSPNPKSLVFYIAPRLFSH